MGKEDISLKSYLTSPVRYADLWNGGVFGGMQVVHPEELEEINPALDKADEQAVLERHRDMVMCECRSGQKLSVWVVENQKTIDYGMPARIMLQEALEYDRQLKEAARRNQELDKESRRSGAGSIYADAGERLYKIRKLNKLYPVVTLVVYWGDGEWKGPRNLHEMIVFDRGSREEAEMLRMLIPQYPIYVLELSSFEDTKNFKSELRHLFELYKRRNDKVNFCKYVEQNEKNWNMSEEAWYVLSNLTHSKKMRNLIKRKEIGEGMVMCKALDDLVDDAIAEGKAEGKAEILLELLEEYGEVPEEIRKEVMEQSDSCIIKRWIKLAVRGESVEDFVVHMHG